MQCAIVDHVREEVSRVAATLPALTICALYKSRWQVELFFKWMKQHLGIKRFFGTSENAVKAQVWIDVSIYVLVAIIEKQLRLDASLHTLLQILSVTRSRKCLCKKSLQSWPMARAISIPLTN